MDSSNSNALAYVFPGQGSQSVGMGSDLLQSSAAGADVLHQADAILGFAITELMTHGPANVLEDTYNAQPAILAVSVAALASLRERAETEALQIEPSMVAGHSLGEFSALVAAGSLDYPTALQLVRERGRLMKQAGDQFPGGMAAILGLDDQQIEAVCDQASEFGVIVPANRNCPGQTVISGEVAALEKAMELAKDAGAKRTARLGVSIASHSPLMGDANAAFYRLVEEAGVDDPRVPVVGNVAALPISKRSELLEELRLQMENPVDWTGSVSRMVADGATRFVEIGSGSVLGGLNKRINRDVPTTSYANVTSS